VEDTSHTEGRPWEGPSPDASSELTRLAALPLEQRAAALAELVQRLEEELDAT
jgi:hypothetical protein